MDLIRIFWSFVLVFAAMPMGAMTLETKGNTLFASGAIGDDYVAFDTAFKNPDIDTLVLVNSPGGDLWNGLRIGRMIAGKSIKTVVAGRCASSCSLLFMGGKERMFTDTHPPAQTYVGIHGPHNKYTQVVTPESAVQLYAYYKQQMGPRFNSVVMNMALFNMTDSSGMLRVFDSGRSPRRAPFHCPSYQSPSSECTQFKAEDAFTLGIVTSDHYVPVELPTSMAHTTSLFGQALKLPYEDYTGFLNGEAKKRCDTFSCEHEMRRFDQAEPFSAIALASDGEGMGYTQGQRSTEMALIKALTACNFPSGSKAKLCEVQVINGLDIRPFYQGMPEAHGKAIKDLSPPNLKYYASEEFGGMFTRATGLRTQKWNDITPQSLEGITTLGTHAMVELMRGSQAPLLLDVAGSTGETLPSALILANGGFAYEDIQRDAPYQQRFTKLLDVLAPRRDAPIVFFCHGRESWLSVNASLRAKALGFTQVYWYRGGMEAWEKAALPLVKSLAKAAVI